MKTLASRERKMADNKNNTTETKENDGSKLVKKNSLSESVVHAQSQLLEIGNKVRETLESPIENLYGEELQAQLKEYIKLAAQAEVIAALTNETLLEAEQASGAVKKRLVEDCEGILHSINALADRISRIIKLLEAKVRMSTEQHQYDALKYVKYHTQLSKKVSDSVEFLAVFGSTWFLWDLADNFIKLLMKNHIQTLPYDKVETYGIPILLVFTWMVLRVLRDHPKLEKDDASAKR